MENESYAMKGGEGPHSYAQNSNFQVTNDFNTLFKNLPPNRKYFAAGVPGSFRGRLFPRETLHLVHSSSSLNWLSAVPKEITDRTSNAWNKGRVHVTNAPKEVSDAYATQYKMDLETFLHARAQELVENGLMVLQIPAASDIILDSDLDPNKVFELLGSCLMDMTKEGLVSEEKVDSFNVPFLYSPVKNVKAILEANDCFSIEWMETLDIKDIFVISNAQTFALTYRAVLEELIEKHFGEGIVDEIFDRYTKKVEAFPDIMNSEKLKIAMLYVLLKRKSRA
ncbi:SAM dependent carboxyl methyltransferase [Sesbania bispinosa]|nr:SAM dependent carboxyl methyltransferase [Sesbania bispinosa]